MHKMVVIGASAGGIPALQTIVSQLPSHFPASILVVIHISENHESVLPEVLKRAGSLDAVHPYNGQQVEPSIIYVAPPNYHMVLIDHHIQLKNTPKENRHRPAIDPLFRSAAQAHGRDVIGIILSGALDDGTGGLLDIKKQNGIAIVQDPEEAMFSSMPESALNYVDVDYVLPAHEIGMQLSQIILEDHHPTEQTANSANTPQNKLNIIHAEEVMLHDLHDQPGTMTPYACPDCNGNLWVSTENGFPQYWCHIGHRYTKRTLFAEKSDKIEAILFETIRNLKEGVALGQETLKEDSLITSSAVLKDIQEQVSLREKQLELIQQILQRI